MMMRRLFLTTALTLALSGAARAQAPATELRYGAWGFDAEGRDMATRPGDSFFRYANGGWLDRHEIPSDKPGVSLRLLMTDLAEARVHALLEGAAKTAPHQPTTTEGKIGAFYKAFMDEGRIEALGAKPLANSLAAIRAADSRTKLAGLMGHSVDDFQSALFSVFIDADPKDPTRYAVFVNQAGLGLPDRDYYLEASFAPQKAKYQAYVEQMLTLSGWPDAKANAAAIVALETEIAQASWSKIEQRDQDKVYNPMTVAELATFAPGFDWAAFMGDAQLAKTSKVVVGEKTAFPKLAAIYAKTPVPVLQAWLAFSLADHASPYLSKAFVDANFEMRAKTLSGQPELQARWKRGVHAVAGGDYLADGHFGDMGWAVGQVYSAKYFPPASKAKVQALVADLKTAYHARIEKLDWMGPATKAEALKKLETYTVKVGYPDKPRDYSKLSITDDDLVGDVRRAAQDDWAVQVRKLSGPVDRAEWQMTPQTNDAYNGSLRDIVFPAGILQPPIFDPNADPAVNYGAIGGVIGHEITHGFDDQGRKIDAAGVLRDWWTPDDAKAFEARAAKLGAQYSAFEPLPGFHVKGELTMGENIADLGGLTVALDAYHASLKGKPAPVIDGLTGDQRVFLGWAQAWRGKVRDDFLKKQVVSDPHSPRQYRVDGVVRNIDAWYDAFGVKPGDQLYTAPADRVRIW